MVRTQEIEGQFRGACARKLYLFHLSHLQQMSRHGLRIEGGYVTAEVAWCGRAEVSWPGKSQANGRIKHTEGASEGHLRRWQRKSVGTGSGELPEFSSALLPQRVEQRAELSMDSVEITAGLPAGRT